MAIQHRSQIETSIGRLNQTAYGTATAAGASNFRRIISTSQEVGDLDTQFQDDAGYDQGSDLAQDVWAITNSSGLTLSPDFCFQDLGYFLKDVLGSYAVSGTGPYTHTFTPLNVNTTRQLPSRSILKKYGGIKTVLFRDMVCKSGSITFAKTGRITTSFQYGGSGYYEENRASEASPSLTSDREWAYNGQYLGFKFTDATPTETTYTCAIEQGVLTWNNPEADPGYRQCSSYLVSGDPTSGAVKKEDLVGVRDYMFNCTVRLDSNDPMRGYLKNGTDLELEIVVNGETPADTNLTLTHDRARLIEVREVSDAGGFIGLSIQARLLATSGVIGFSAVLENDVVSYAV